MCSTHIELAFDFTLMPHFRSGKAKMIYRFRIANVPTLIFSIISRAGGSPYFHASIIARLMISRLITDTIRVICKARSVPDFIPAAVKPADDNEMAAAIMCRR